MHRCVLQSHSLCPSLRADRSTDRQRLFLNLFGQPYQKPPPQAMMLHVCRAASQGHAGHLAAFLRLACESQLTWRSGRLHLALLPSPGSEKTAGRRQFRSCVISALPRMSFCTPPLFGMQRTSRSRQRLIGTWPITAFAAYRSTRSQVWTYWCFWRRLADFQSCSASLSACRCSMRTVQLPAGPSSLIRPSLWQRSNLFLATSGPPRLVFLSGTLRCHWGLPLFPWQLVICCELCGQVRLFLR